MRKSTYDALVALARAASRRSDAEDLLHEALIAALAAGRSDLTVRENRAWLHGTIRNLGRMEARSGYRRKQRERAWADTSLPAKPPDTLDIASLLQGLRPGLKAVAALVLTGHNRREIAYLLNLPDTALRQRITSLRRHLKTRGIAAPGELSGLHLDLAYGKIRKALLPALIQHGGTFASHDPDGHLFVVRRSQDR